MELRQLRTFVAVAELRHFARAAALCNLSQPAVSHQIALLEEEVGTKLLNRARRVSLTVAGEVFLEEARRILGAVDRAHERMQEVARGAVGRIRLGATATPGLYVLPPLLATYRIQHAPYDLRFEIGSVHTIAERVARNDLDMAIVAGPLPSSELQARSLASDDLVIVAPRTSPLVRARAVKPAELEAETWLLREDGSDTRRQLAGWWHRHRLAPPRTMTFDHPDAVKRAVMAGLGVAMVSRLTVEEDLACERLAIVALTTALPSRQFFVIDHPQKHHGAACRAMLQLFQRTFSSRGGASSPAGEGILCGRKCEAAKATTTKITIKARR
jgi:LysR family transcriptional regulator, transcriptional activator of the cysJI operon